MQIPNWVKVLWWTLLVATLSYFLWARLPDLLSGKAAVADVAVFGVWMALLLAPLFSEVTLLGVTLKNEIEELKDHIASQVSEMRADIRNAVDFRATVSPTFNLPAAPSDAQLPALEARIKAAVAEALAEQGVTTASQVSQPELPEGVSYLFSTRFNLETELRRIASGHGLGIERQRVLPVHLLIRSAVESGLLSAKLGEAIRGVFSVCTPAIHGETVTPAQVDFVRDVAPELISALRAIN